jgi:hypothetical protein
MRAFLNISIYLLFYIDLFLLARLVNVGQVLALTMVGAYLVSVFLTTVIARGALRQDVVNKKDQPVHEQMWFTAAAPVIYITQRNKRQIGEVAGVLLAWVPIVLIQPLYLLHYALLRRKVLKHW